jgi:hypothetical protein
MVAEDVTITEEVLVEVWWRKKFSSRRKDLHQEKVLVGRSDRNSAQEKVDLAEETSAQEGGFHLTDLELKVHLMKHQDVLKALVIHQ